MGAVNYWHPARRPIDLPQSGHGRRRFSRAPASTLSTMAFRQILNSGLMPDRLGIQSHQVEDLRWNVGPNRQSEILGGLEGDGMVVGPSALR